MEEIRIPETVIDEYIKYSNGGIDADASLFAYNFSCRPGGRVLVVGAHDEATAHMMTRIGMEVVGFDLREYDSTLPARNFTYIRRDFCDPDPKFLEENWGTFDAFVSLSTIEHFGLGTYSEGSRHAFYDVIALWLAEKYLKEGGKAYVSVPFGGVYREVIPHWRVYDLGTVRDRLMQDLEMVNFLCAVAGPISINGNSYQYGSPIAFEEVLKHTGNSPHISALAIMRKRAISRLSPDGR